MSAGNLSVDSNVTGLYFAEEVLGQPKVLPGSPTWFPVEPNSYAEFGGQTKTVKREPINAGRQKRKGEVVGIDVAAGFNIDFTTKVPYVMLQGFMFADWREKANAVASAVTGTAYTVPSGGAAFIVGDLAFAEGFASSGNNGLKYISTNGATNAINAPGLVPEGSSSGTVTRVGRQFGAGDLTLSIFAGRPVLNCTAGEFSTLGLIPGEWLFLGGDAGGNRYDAAGANGWYRILATGLKSMSFDRWPGDANGGIVTDTGAGKSIQLFMGHVVKNEANPALQKFRTYQFERSLGTGKFQYELGCGANTFKVNVKNNDKVTADLSYVALDEDTTPTAAKAGTRAALPQERAYNAATSFSRLRLLGQDGVTPVTAILTDLTLTIDNGIEPLDGITNSLGSLDLKSGDFSVSGSVEAYFSSVSAIAAVKANADCSIDFAMVENVGVNAQGWVFDVPLLMLGDGRLKVEKDKPIKLPLTIDAAGHSTLNHTLLAQRHAYLPQLAL